jgi:hypothetical protein
MPDLAKSGLGDGRSELAACRLPAGEAEVLDRDAEVRELVAEGVAVDSQ